MRKAGVVLQWLGVLLLIVTGCYSTQHKRVEKPTLDEQYNVPPDGDKRYSQPQAFPQKYLNQDDPRKSQESPGAGSGGGPMKGSMGAGIQ